MDLMSTVLILVMLVVLFIISPKMLITFQFDKSVITIPIMNNINYESMLAVLIATELLLIAIPRYRVWKINTDVDTELPSVIRVIRDGLRAGLTLNEITGLVRRVGKGRVGEILSRAVAAQMSGESTIRDYVLKETGRIGNENLASLAIILDTVLRRGTKEVEVLDMAYRSFDSYLSYTYEKSNSLRPYVALIYVIMILYVVLASIIAYFLLPQIARMSLSTVSGVPALTVSITIISTQLFATLLGLSIIIQSLIAGAIIGRVTYGKASVGMLHASILMIVLTAVNYILYLTLYLH